MSRFSRISLLIQAWLQAILIDQEWWTEDDENVAVRIENIGVTDDACARIARVVFEGSVPVADQQCSSCAVDWIDTWRIDLLECFAFEPAYSEDEGDKEVELQELIAMVLAVYLGDPDALSDPLVESSQTAITAVTPIAIQGGIGGYSLGIQYKRKMVKEDRVS